MNISNISDNGTKTTTPRHIWIYAVELGAIKAGAKADSVKAVRSKLFAWYEAGEPIWMAIDGLKQLARGYDIAERDEADARAMRRMAMGEIRETVENGVPGIGLYSRRK